MSSSGREVLLGVGGGIAAYKACDLVRRLRDEGFLVTVVPTPAALNFVGTATWEALSGRAVFSQVWENVAEVPHIRLAELADYLIIAPATADLLARIAQGRADDLLTTVILASGAPKLLVPAMHPQMWNDSATQTNVEALRKRGFIVMEPDVGRLTGSDSGAGRFPETSRILESLHEMAGVNADLLGKRFLVTAGGTREPIDPVRFIGNRSSGKQGFAIAQAAVARGARVHLIAANCPELTLEGVEITRVETSKELSRALTAGFPQCDVLVMCAAIADARPAHPSEEKIKKSQLTSIELELNPDLLTAVAAQRQPGQIIVGFAAETSDLLSSAQKKLEAKNLDILYVNDVSGGAVFGSDFTKGSIILRSGKVIEVSHASKDTLAHVILDQLF
jgi:phosphopantothenoylcysteine decarboxylase/phosphopantothenate--cysteine ligase